MSFEERNTVAGILISLISWGLMISVIMGRHRAGVYDGADGLMLWARSVLWLILISIGIGIALTILFNIGYAVITGDKKPIFLKDERDDQIGLRGLQVTLAVLSAGIIGAIIALAFGIRILFVLNMILAACALGDMAGTLTKLALYRQGLAV